MVIISAVGDETDSHQEHATALVAPWRPRKDEAMEQSLRKLRLQTQAWKKHIDRMRLEDRERFIDWLSQALSRREMAVIIDAEVDRRSLWEIYLNEHYGP